MEEINTSVQRNAAMTQTASEQAKHASNTARAVGEQVSALVQTMQEIHQSSQRIRDIVGVIDSIAFQTNILALNAAVEAARAGEHGRGFAVVASEVRSLAQHSANAAQEIKSIIEDNVHKMDTGNHVAQQAGESVNNVVQAITHVDGTVSEVAEATREQSKAINHVSQSIQGLDETTQQNAALVEETAAAATNLDEQVQRLTEAVNRFRVRH
jgi:methyl-accepting chemotaxis protein